MSDLTTTRKSTEMPNNELPDLSTWHRVPIGATIPAGTPYAYVYKGSLAAKLDGHNCDVTVDPDDFSNFTEHSITRPLPNEEGAMIVALPTIDALDGGE